MLLLTSNTATWRPRSRSSCRSGYGIDVQLRGYELPDIHGRTGTRNAVNFAPAVKNREGRNGTYAEAVAEFGDGIGVHLGDQPLAPCASGQLVELGRHHPTRPAPRRPEVDDHRQRG